jgi:hypothetical protein
MASHRPRVHSVGHRRSAIGGRRPTAPLQDYSSILQRLDPFDPGLLRIRPSRNERSAVPLGCRLLLEELREREGPVAVRWDHVVDGGTRIRALMPLFSSEILLSPSRKFVLSGITPSIASRARRNRWWPGSNATKCMHGLLTGPTAPSSSTPTTLPSTPTCSPYKTGRKLVSVQAACEQGRTRHPARGLLRQLAPCCSTKSLA